MAEYLHEEALPGAQDTELLRRSGHRAVLPLVMAVRAHNSVSPALRWQTHRHVLVPELTAGPTDSLWQQGSFGGGVVQPGLPGGQRDTASGLLQPAAPEYNQPPADT